MVMQHEGGRGAEPLEGEGASEPTVDTCCLCPCGTRVAFAATYVAALSAQTVCLLSGVSTKGFNRAILKGVVATLLQRAAPQ